MHIMLYWLGNGGQDLVSAVYNCLVAVQLEGFAVALNKTFAHVFSLCRMNTASRPLCARSWQHVAHAAPYFTLLGRPATSRLLLGMWTVQPEAHYPVALKVKEVLLLLKMVMMMLTMGPIEGSFTGCILVKTTCFSVFHVKYPLSQCNSHSGSESSV